MRDIKSRQHPVARGRGKSFVNREVEEECVALSSASQEQYQLEAPPAGYYPYQQCSTSNPPASPLSPIELSAQTSSTSEPKPTEHWDQFPLEYEVCYRRNDDFRWLYEEAAMGMTSEHPPVFAQAHDIHTSNYLPHQYPQYDQSFHHRNLAQPVYPWAWSR
ncbi:hypothetical protein CC1G_10865 [Coprinopsis cinerea okayama7|uniref:Uncharacterized protein n=1 Tax=Coprinopsis cinerea (strain Okayama-7 / 130 / ATCC MYA-4618 / FGSC 9003) TaxID=240176 RepID=A8NKU5_COPC7|nr:hypothetical protein CC1G_10865 [Coprinopsis cinerea okayama7\|eukprot:XP_001834547.1 hypothetical protein CC1G_10865 [Coprinopsis cinerea okayama7\